MLAKFKIFFIITLCLIVNKIFSQEDFAFSNSEWLQSVIKPESAPNMLYFKIEKK